MEYVECYFGCGDPLLIAGVLLAALVATFLAVRRRAWTLVGGLSGIPLAEWYLDGAEFALVVCAALLIAGLAGLAMSDTKDSSSEAAYQRLKPTARPD